MAVIKRKSSNPLSLNCYTIRFNKKNVKEYLKIKEVFNPNSFKVEMANFAKTYSTFAYSNEENDRMLFLNEILSLNGNIFSGVMKRGHNGQETDIDELEDGKPKTVSNVTSNQYNSIYFYFLVSQPNAESDYLIFIAQTYKQFGFKELFEQSYKSYIAQRFGDKFTCSIIPLSIPKLFSKYLKEGDIRKLRFRKHSLPKNAENLLGPDDNMNIKDYEVETSIRARKKGFTGVKKIDFETTAFVEVYDNLGIDFDDAYADVSINGRIRILNITNPEKFTASFDITDRVKLQPGTLRPVYEDLDIEAKKILNEEILINL